ncbi:MAG: hypothetical protein GVY32_07560 [Gammaproteobacteria bacterium]|nr:hypothetical protein [Gammaproteobacteria bacterium]
MASVANAVNVNPDGLGQVLLYPYYTARGGNDTLISIVNTTERGKAVKIRFIEALNSREVLDFNIYMSPYDVWTAAVTATADGGGKMVTSDSTCTAPYFYDAEAGFGERAFLDFEYAGDGGPQGIERTASGYIEVIEMHTMLPQSASSDDPTNPGYVPFASKHVSGLPRDCQTLVNYWAPGFAFDIWNQGSVDFGFDTDLGATGGLFGAGSVINVSEGTMFSYNATTVDGFWVQGDSFHTNPASLEPDLGSGTNNVSNVFVNGDVVTHDWTGAPSVAALNATLTYDELMNEYSINEDLGGRSEWVLTFPTKRFHADANGGYTAANDPIPPFTRTWHIRADGSLNLPCEDIAFRVWDREETQPTDPVGDVIVSPPPPPETPSIFQLCREANVVRFTTTGSLPDESEIMKEPLRADYPRLSYVNFQLPGYTDGWVQYDLTTVPGASPVAALGPRRSEPGENVDTGVFERVEGLPVIGFWANTFTNGDVAGTLANYGGSFDHRGSRSVVASD